MMPVDTFRPLNNPELVQGAQAIFAATVVIGIAQLRQQAAELEPGDERTVKLLAAEKLEERME